MSTGDLRQDLMQSIVQSERQPLDGEGRRSKFKKMVTVESASSGRLNMSMDYDNQGNRSVMFSSEQLEVAFEPSAKENLETPKPVYLSKVLEELVNTNSMVQITIEDEESEEELCVPLQEPTQMGLSLEPFPFT